MNVKALAVLALLAAMSPAHAQPAAPASPPAEQRAEDEVRIALDTQAGPIVLALDRARAPKTVANFLAYVDAKALDGEGFYRAMPYGKGGLIQGGITSDSRKLRDPVAHEAASQTGLTHRAGTIAMANAGPGTARSDFFILTEDIPAFDTQFAPFGRVVEGMDVVRAILAAPTSPTRGEGPMKGQMLEPPVQIRTARRVD